jgi:hypothetical protein
MIWIKCVQFLSSKKCVSKLQVEFGYEYRINGGRYFTMEKTVIATHGGAIIFVRELHHQ